jgi:hypothetical protein
MPGTAIQCITVFFKDFQAGIGKMFERSISERKSTSSILVALRTDRVLNERSLSGSGTRFGCCQALIARLVTLEFVEVFTEPRAGLV